MQKKEIPSPIGQTPLSRPIRERVGLLVYGAGPTAISHIEAAEMAGVRQVWMTQVAQPIPAPDTLTTFAAAAAQTSRVGLATAIVQTYPRHPLVLAQQVLALEALAPSRLRLGIGPGVRPSIEGIYGIPMTTPLHHLREYVAVLRAALWEGKIDHHGHFYTVRTTLPDTPATPILISALREGAFHLAGEIADGAISWMCPIPYLLQRALPALRAGAASSGRPVPPLVAHIMVALNEDRQAVLEGLRLQSDSGRFFGRLSFYAHMFADAGFPVSPDGSWSDELVDNLVISGNEATIVARLRELLALGLDELLIMPLPVADPKALSQLMRLVGQL